jgi:hypothetical protein
VKETEDDIRPLGAGGRFDPVAVAKLAAKVAAVIVPAILSAVAAYRSAAGETVTRVQVSKDSAEAGFQVTKHAVEELQVRMLALEQALAKRAAAEAPPRTRRSKPPAPVVLPKPPVPLPNDLDKAKQQVYSTVAAAAPPPHD